MIVVVASGVTSLAADIELLDEARVVAETTLVEAI